MDLIPHLDPQLLNALVLVLKELQRLLALILHEDEFGAGDVEEPGNVVRISNVVLLTNIAQCLDISPFDETSIVAEIGNVACANMATFARLHQDDGRLCVCKPFHKLRIGHVGFGEADLVVSVVCNNVAMVFGQVDANRNGDLAFLENLCTIHDEALLLSYEF